MFGYFLDNLMVNKTLRRLVLDNLCCFVLNLECQLLLKVYHHKKSCVGIIQSSKTWAGSPFVKF